MIRKNLRKMQKMKKHEHFTNKRRNKTEPNKQEVDIMPESASVQKTSTRNLNIQEKLPSIKKNIEETTLKKAKKEKMENEIKKQRVKQLRVANKIEDKNIKKREMSLSLFSLFSKLLKNSIFNPQYNRVLSTSPRLLRRFLPNFLSPCDIPLQDLTALHRGHQCL